MGGKSGSVTIGYKYYLGLHMVVCHGPVDAVGPIIAGERIAYDGRLTSSGKMTIDSPELFGGEKKEGGIQGDVDVLFGEDTQEQNPYLLSQDGFTTENLPGFRGVLSLIANKIYIASMSPYPKPWWVAVSRYSGLDWLSSLAKIDIDDDDSSIASANAAHMIRECLTNSDWGLGYSSGMIDQTSFAAAAQTLYDENFGLSMILTEQAKVEDFVQIILQHINGAMYPDTETGKFSLSLIREDYVIDDLPVFNESNIIKLNSFQRPLLSDLVNEVIIVFRRRGAIQDTALTFQNLALIQIQGTVISQTVEYPGIDNDDIATRVGQRELQQQSSDILQIQITVNRSAWNIETGEAFVFQWESYQLEQVVMRVTKINYGTLQNGQIVIDAVQDVFALPDTSYITPQDTKWADPISTPYPIVTDRLDEVPYFEIATGVFADGAEDLLDDGDTFIQYSAIAALGTTGSGFQMWVNQIDTSDANYDIKITSPYTPKATLSDDISYLDNTGISVSGLGFDQSDVIIGSYGFLNDEVVRIDAIDSTAGTVDLGRGCLDTIPAQHSAGSYLWFTKNNSAVDYTVYQELGVLNVKGLSQTGLGVLPIADATAIEITLSARQAKPYPAANIRHSSSNLFYPEIVVGPLAAETKFSGRNRISQTVPSDINDFFDPNITPEANTLYTVQFFSEIDLLKSTPTTEYTGLAITTSDFIQDWLTELVDSDVGVYAPPSGEDLYMGLIDTSIGGTLSPLGVIADSTNIEHTELGAKFVGNGYFNFGDFALDATNFAISLEFIPEDEGDEYQLLIGKYTDAGLSSVDIFSFGWRRSDNSLFYSIGSNTTTAVTNSVDTVIPGRRNQLLIVRDSGIKVFLNNRELTTIGIGSINFTGRQWTAGADYNSTDLGRRNFFTGILREVRFWDATILTKDQVWPETRLNSAFRVVTKTERDGIDSLQEYDYTIPHRAGWDLFWDNKFNGSF